MAATPVIMLLLMTAPYLAGRILSAATGCDCDERGLAAIGQLALYVYRRRALYPDGTHGRDAATMGAATDACRVFDRDPGIRYGRRVPSAVAQATDGLGAAAVLVPFFPANIYAAINRVPMGGYAWAPAYFDSGAA